MQTFLPYSNFVKSAICLDGLRLGKQRVECIQILNALFGISNGWRNHPATRMWEGYIPSLVSYAEAICCEWRGRGFLDNCLDTIKIFKKLPLPANTILYDPWWLGEEEFHSSHRANLLRKDFDHYKQFGWLEMSLDFNNIEYYWPCAR